MRRIMIAQHCAGGYAAHAGGKRLYRPGKTAAPRQAVCIRCPKSSDKYSCDLLLPLIEGFVPGFERSGMRAAIRDCSEPRESRQIAARGRSVPGQESRSQ